MRTLLDTNILLRANQPSSPHFQSAVNAVVALIKADHRPCISSQTIYEFLAVATRPVAAMRVNAIEQLLTFNDSDFRRFADIRVLTPDQILAGPLAP